MANDYVRYLNQRCLHDIGLSYTDLSPEKNNSISPQSSSKDDVISNEEFEVMFAHNAINSFLNHREEQKTIACECILDISSKDSDAIKKEISVNKKHSDLVSFIDYRFIIRGLKRNFKGTLKFVDQNEKTKPRWCRNIKIAEPTEESLSNERIKNCNGQMIIEIDINEKKKSDKAPKPFSFLNESKLCHLDINDSFWDSLKSGISTEKIPFIEKEEELKMQLLFPERKDIQNKTARKKWMTINNPSIIQHKKTKAESNEKRHCLWQKLCDLIMMKITNNTHELFDDIAFNKSLIIMKDLIKEYLLFSKQEKILVGKAEMSSFFFLRQKCNLIRMVNQCHFDEKETIEPQNCHVCMKFKKNGIFKYAIVYACYLISNIMKIDFSGLVSKIVNNVVYEY